MGVSRIWELGQAASDSERLRLAKANVVRAVGGSALVLAFFAVFFAVVGAPSAAWTLGITAAVHLANLGQFSVTSRLRPFLLTTEIAALISIPAMTYVLAGMGGNSVALIQGVFVVIGAALSGRPRDTMIRVAVFAAVVVGTTLAIHLWPPAPLDVPPWVTNTWTAAMLIACVTIVTAMTYPLARGRRQLSDALKVEHERSERLLHNVLPVSIAARLKQSPSTIAEKYDEVTVLFADIVGFTTLSTRLTPNQIVEMLDSVFSEFDALADELRLEKIKTIGDAYMVVAGAPERRDDHAAVSAEMALRMLQVIARNSRASELQLRIGIQSGPVVAGVIGKRKFIYDLWGDTVNTASRMESHGVPGEIQVGEAAYQLLRDRYRFEARGMIPIKGKGELAAFLLRGRAERD